MLKYSRRGLISERREDKQVDEGSGDEGLDVCGESRVFGDTLDGGDETAPVLIQAERKTDK